MAKIKPETESTPTSPTLGLDGPTAPEAAPQIVARQGDDGRPYCATHNCLMTATSSKENVTHYGCPVPGCGATGKRARQVQQIPTKPLPCPEAVCRTSNGEQFLESNPRLASLAHLEMVCPACGYHVKVPRPQLDGRIRQHRAAPAAEDLGAR